MSVKLLNTQSQATAQTPYQDILPKGSQQNSNQNTASNIQLPGLTQKSAADTAAPQRALNCCDIFDWLRRKIGPMPLPFPLPNPRLPFPKQPTPSPRDPREPGFPKGGPVLMPKPFPPRDDRPRIGLPIQAPIAPPILPLPPKPFENGFKLPPLPEEARFERGIQFPLSNGLEKLIESGHATAFEPNTDLSWFPHFEPEANGSVRVPISVDSRVDSIHVIAEDGTILATATVPPPGNQPKGAGAVSASFDKPFQSLPPNVKLVVTYRTIDSKGRLGPANQAKYLDVPDPSKMLRNSRNEIPSMTWQEPLVPRKPGEVNLLPKEAIPLEATGKFSWTPPLTPEHKGSIRIPVPEHFRAVHATIISSDGLTALSSKSVYRSSQRLLEPGVVKFNFDEALSSFPAGSKLVLEYDFLKRLGVPRSLKEVKYFEIQDPNQAIRNY